MLPTGSGLSTLVAARMMGSAASDTRQRLAVTSQELTTGRSANPVRALGPGTRTLMSLETERRAADAYLDTTKLVMTRIGAMETALETVASDLPRLAADALGAGTRGDLPAMEAQGTDAQAALVRIVSALNTQTGGRHLFSGAATDTAPLAGADAVNQVLQDRLAATTGTLQTQADADALAADLDLAFEDAGPGGPNTFTGTVYLGDTGARLAADVGPGQRIAYGVRADNPAVRDLLKGLAMIVRAGDSKTPDHAQARARLIELGANRIQAGLDALTGVRAGLGTAAREIEDAGKRHDAARGALDTRIAGLVGVDPYEAASELRALESQLETTYLITGRLQNLTLTRFL
ncbi:flagellin N-terminal helical domain-containing protein [Futiania mangrovi]|uniref:Flagellin n=1 Tax=Futiania mangrovi TaxID=2959716 RepID=A0A9J6PGB6_9PROT|nr:flagellin [Futiania mangrovii]MCP1336843.1 flagellin [Futiania mangrovii]